MASILPNAVTQFIDANGNPLALGTVAFFIPGTLTPKDTYQDSGATVLNTNPVTLNAAGEAIIYGSGSYRQQVFDSAGNLIWDQLTADTATGGTGQGGTSTGTPNAQVVAASSFAQINEQQLVFIVGAGLTNSGGTTIAPGGGSGIPVLKDTASGPAALTGGELVAGNAYLLTYDIVRGAFHVNATPQSQPTTFEDDQFRIFNAADNTKKIAFDASGITTGDTRDYTGPDKNGTLMLNTTFKINIVKFTSSGTYNPSTGLLYAVVECVGSGGGGGGAAQNSGSSITGAGGGSGGYSRTTLSASAIGASQAVTVGTAGAGGAAGNHNGTSGSAVSFGTLCVANGGNGGAASTSAATGNSGTGASAGTGDIAALGNAGGSGQGFNNGTYPGFGAGAFFGGAVPALAGSAGTAGSAPGGGGSGGQANASTNFAGGNGATGIVIVTEFISL